MAYKIVIDPGHGGRDPGAVYQGRQEKDDVLDLGLAVGQLLEDRGIDVVYTRIDDVYNTPLEKATMGNNADADLFVSIHRNAAVNPGMGSGAEVLVFNDAGLPAAVARSVLEGMEAAGFENRGVTERRDLIVLRRTRMPAVLLEVGFIDNPEDNAKFDANFETLAQDIADGILRVIPVALPEPAGMNPMGISDGAAMGMMAGTMAGVDAGTVSGLTDGTAAGMNTGAAAGMNTGTPMGMNTGEAADMTAGMTAGMNTGTPMGRNTGTATGMNTGTMTGRTAGTAGEAAAGNDMNRMPVYDERVDGRYPDRMPGPGPNPYPGVGGGRPPYPVTGSGSAYPWQSSAGTSNTGSPAGTLYRVQTGAFRERRYADAMRNELLASGFPAFILYRDGLYKVQVGAFAILENAIRMERVLREYGYNTYITT